MSITACGGGASSSTQSSSATAAKPEFVAMVPNAVRQAGKLRVGTDPTYPPFESIDTDGKTIVGLDADLAKAIGGLLDLDVEFVPTGFDALIPSLAANKVDMAMSSIGDTKAREETVDFATYYWNGSLLLVAKGNPKALTAEQTCGGRIGVIRGSLQQTTFLPAQEESCKAAGKPAPTADVYQTAPQAQLALQSNRIDGVLTDAPPVADAAKKNPAKFESVGPLLKNPNPGGVALPKESKLTSAVNAAINELISNGTYQSILDKWNLGDIKIDKSEINGARS
ncbi:ABC transporter substrate-binding protein [Paenarthrobacter sp. YJN-5]|uniref:ABC transporter substrate-binding protein n=1 Tax=Paenarthrobacter sp. YJN-5 TaxID=2735316 RepID=UPI001877FA82|nr:ABC transporter substrate-binding protein [Paenarthrobacter sp. YJN-5]QOT19878.1 ABC transporter substrate-binding protein [Paenarthrobacter sp. YJN-5]